MDHYKEETIKHYKSIITAEAEINHWKDVPTLLEAEDLLNITSQLLEIALSATVLRSYNNNYGMTDDKRAYESVSAHTNLMLAILDREIVFKTHAMIIEPPLDIMSYRAIMEAARRHDLPENVIGDIPDNGDRNDIEKAVSEHYYLLEYSKLSPKYSEQFEKAVSFLLDEMEKKSTTIGHSLYMADKTAAVLMALVEDFKGCSPVMSEDNPLASQNDRDNMKLCDYHGKFCKASEMWTASFIKTRKMIQYDETGFFTAIIVLATLVVNGNKWYKWREKDYETTW